ncbi:MAG TPA: coenzyme F420-0:L-glutamate ligase [Candidatus Dormibacteraeota bacterium]|nr:coenzyme F420-0:L-glutamate ligase [Candidatus Dormibacteraeota bacterium]
MGDAHATVLTAATTAGVSILPVTGVPEVGRGDDLARVIIDALDAQGLGLLDGDVVVVASKVVSKAEGRGIAELPPPGARAGLLADETGFEPGLVELILSESRAVLRSRPRVLVVETRQGLVCANAGVDRSNTGNSGTALLLPVDSDASAEHLRTTFEGHFNKAVAVLVSDTFGRPFRHGLVNVAIGVAGIKPIRDYRGQADPHAMVLQGTEIAVADEVCSAAELVMNKLDRVPVAVVRGYQWEPGAGGMQPLMRDPATDYFR